MDGTNERILCMNLLIRKYKLKSRSKSDLNPARQKGSSTAVRTPTI